MSCVLPRSQETDLRLDDIAARLRDHEWVQQVRPVPSTIIPDQIGCSSAVKVFVVPSAAGVRALRRRGKTYLVAAWERHLRRPGAAIEVRIDWRLTEALPTPGHPVASAEPGPQWLPIISDLALDADSRRLTCRLFVPYDLPIFGGHFPSAPIVPGVIQVGWAVELAHLHGLVAGDFTGISAAKFRRLVQPGMILAARLERGPQTEQLQFWYETVDTVVSSGRLKFGAAHG